MVNLIRIIKLIHNFWFQDRLCIPIVEYCGSTSRPDFHSQSSNDTESVYPLTNSDCCYSILGSASFEFLFNRLDASSTYHWNHDTAGLPLELVSLKFLSGDNEAIETWVFIFSTPGPATLTIFFLDCSSWKSAFLILQLTKIKTNNIVLVMIILKNMLYFKSNWNILYLQE